MIYLSDLKSGKELANSGCFSSKNLSKAQKDEDNKKSEDILKEIIDIPIYNKDGKNCVDVLDLTYLKTVTYEDLLKHNNPMYILKSSFFAIKKNYSDFLITNEEISSLIRARKLNIYDLSSSYDNVSNHDMVIYLANMLYSKNYTPIIYTCDAETALDLILMDFTVKSIYAIDESKKCEDLDNDVVYFYDTCYFMEHLFDIDFSSNHHIFPVSMLEELLPNNKESKYFFVFLYLYNKYRKNIEIIFTERSTQKKGRYSYTDLVHLFYCMNLANSEKYKNKKVIFMTLDNQLYYEALSIPNFEVSSFQNLVDMVTENKEEVYDDAVIFDTEEDEVIVGPNEIMDDNEDCEKILESIDEKVNRLTSDHTEIPFIKFYNAKVISCDRLDNIIEHVYDNNYLFKKPLLCSKKQKNKFNLAGDCYSIKVGYHISFKDKPQELYIISGFTSNTAIIKKL